ncbi:hypothetical protein PG999_007486 [Apiospora kogelbergensis]|uniref:Uncharacterized protein n=1 Tax=Apiospora kogelbergensis TaxID=1337665 RepID=A0AAW0QYG4_9PEZI
MTDEEKNVVGDEPRKSVNGWDALDEHIDTLKDKYKRDGGHGNAYEYKFSRTTGTAQSNDGFIADKLAPLILAAPVYADESGCAADGFHHETIRTQAQSHIDAEQPSADASPVPREIIAFMRSSFGRIRATRDAPEITGRPANHRA